MSPTLVSQCLSASLWVNVPLHPYGSMSLCILMGQCPSTSLWVNVPLHPYGSAAEVQITADSTGFEEDNEDDVY